MWRVSELYSSSSPWSLVVLWCSCWRYEAVHWLRSWTLENSPGLSLVDGASACLRWQYGTVSSIWSRVWGECAACVYSLIVCVHACVSVCVWVSECVWVCVWGRELPQSALDASTLFSSLTERCRLASSSVICSSCDRAGWRADWECALQGGCDRFHAWEYVISSPNS